MKIAIYAPFWPPGDAPNGIVTYASYLVPALRLLGHEVFVVTHNIASTEIDSHTIDARKYIRHPNLWTKVRYRIAPDLTNSNEIAHSIVMAMRDLVARHGVEVFEIEESFGWSAELSSSKVLPVLVRLHGPWCLRQDLGETNAKGRFNALRVHRELRAMQSASAVTAPCAAVLKDVQSFYGQEIRGSVIANPQVAVSGEQAWTLEGCEKDTLLFVGRFDSLKGGDLVIQSFLQIANVEPTATLIFVGPDHGVPDVGVENVRFAEYVRHHVPEKIRNRIKYLGSIGHEEVMALRSRCMISLSASKVEAMPYSLLEAMAVGSPIVSPAVGGIPDLLQTERNALLVRRDVDALAGACIRLLRDPQLAKHLGQQAREDCVVRHDPRIIAGQAVFAYEEAIADFQS